MGNLYVTESAKGFSKSIRKITSDGTVSYFAGQQSTSDYVDDKKEIADFYDVIGLIYGHDHDFYLYESAQLRIRRLSPDGQMIKLAWSSGSYESAKYNIAVGEGYKVGIVDPKALTQTPTQTKGEKSLFSIKIYVT